MKRIQSACLIQTLHFQLKEGVPHEQAVAGVREEYAQYKTRLERNHTHYRIMREEPQDDGSIVIEIRKQYNNASCGTYLD